MQHGLEQGGQDQCRDGWRTERRERRVRCAERVCSYEAHFSSFGWLGASGDKGRACSRIGEQDGEHKLHATPGSSWRTLAPASSSRHRSVWGVGYGIPEFAFPFVFRHACHFAIRRGGPPDPHVLTEEVQSGSRPPACGPRRRRRRRPTPPPLPKRVRFLLDDAMPSNVQKQGDAEPG